MISSSGTVAEDNREDHILQSMRDHHITKRTDVHVEYEMTGERDLERDSHGASRGNARDP